MGKFCSKCGSPMRDGSAFCANCGTAAPPDMPARGGFCGKCGSLLDPGVLFCGKCGASVSKQLQQYQPSVQQVQQPPVQQVQQAQQSEQPKQAVQQTVQKAQSVAQQAIKLTGTYAPAGSGEAVLDNAQTAESVVSEVKTILNPFMQLISGVGSFFKGIINAFRNPKALIFSIVTALIWVLVVILKKNNIGWLFTDCLSWLTFGNGGMGGGWVAAVGGVLGKIAVAGGFWALINSAKSVGNGAKQWFTCFKDTSNIGAVLMGAGTALAFYNLFASRISLEDSMAAISGIFLSLSALGAQGGFIYCLARSIMSKKLANGRIPDTGKANALVSGLGMGCTLAVPLSIIPFGYWAYILGGLMLVCGIVLHLTVGRKGAKAV